MDLARNKRSQEASAADDTLTDEEVDRALQHAQKKKTKRSQAFVESSMASQVMQLQMVLGDEKVVFNVGGMKHETLYATLAKKPGTRLFQLAVDRFDSKDEDMAPPDEIFYDRHPGVFAAILDYYRTDQLHVPLDVCGVIMKRELIYWQIDENLIDKCCWDRYCSQVDTQSMFTAMNQRTEEMQSEEQKLKTLKGWKLTQLKMWRILHRPGVSKAALAYAGVTLSFLTLSVVGFCLETAPGFYTVIDRPSRCGGNAQPPVNDSSLISTTETPASKLLIEPHYWLILSDAICTSFFTFDLILKFVTTPRKRKFAISALTIIDVLSILPSWMSFIFYLSDSGECRYTSKIVMEFLVALRMLRIFRVFHMLNYFKPLRILLMALRASLYELIVLLVFCSMFMLIFATLIYYAEGKRDLSSKFRSIPIGLWWGVITITGVGYGDLYPQTPLGYVVGGLCAISGLVLFALTIPVISNNFATLYTHARSRERTQARRHIFNDVRLLRFLYRRHEATAGIRHQTPPPPPPPSPALLPSTRHSVPGGALPVHEEEEEEEEASESNDDIPTEELTVNDELLPAATSNQKRGSLIMSQPLVVDNLIDSPDQHNDEITARKNDSTTAQQTIVNIPMEIVTDDIVNTNEELTSTPGSFHRISGFGSSLLDPFKRSHAISEEIQPTKTKSTRSSESSSNGNLYDARSTSSIEIDEEFIDAVAEELLAPSHLAPVATHIAPVATHLAPVATHIAPVATHLAPVATHIAPAATAVTLVNSDAHNERPAAANSSSNDSLHVHSVVASHSNAPVPSPKSSIGAVISHSSNPASALNASARAATSHASSPVPTSDTSIRHVHSHTSAPITHSNTAIRAVPSQPLPASNVSLKALPSHSAMPVPVKSTHSLPTAAPTSLPVMPSHVSSVSPSHYSIPLPLQAPPKLVASIPAPTTVASSHPPTMPTPSHSSVHVPLSNASSAAVPSHASTTTLPPHISTSLLPSNTSVLPVSTSASHPSTVTMGSHSNVPVLHSILHSNLPNVPLPTIPSPDAASSQQSTAFTASTTKESTK